MCLGSERGRCAHYKAMKVSPLGLTALNRENGFKSPQDLKGDPLGVARPRLRQGKGNDGDGGIFPGAAKSPPRYENRARAWQGRDGPKGAPAVPPPRRRHASRPPDGLHTQCNIFRQQWFP